MAYDTEAPLTPRDRLLLLIDGLRGITDYQLRLSLWYDEDNCGCVLGHGIVKHGRRLNMDLYPQLNGMGDVLIMPRIGGEPVFDLVTGDEETPWIKIGAHFGIDAVLARQLFGGSWFGYVSDGMRREIDAVIAKLQLVADEVCVS